MAHLAFTVDLLEDLEYYFQYSTPVQPTFTKAQSNAVVDLSGTSRVIDFNDRGILFKLVGEAGQQTGDDQQIPQQFIAGTVLDVDGNGVSRTVIAVSRETGQRLAVTASGSDGRFILRPRSLEPVILVAVPLLSEQINAVVLDNILPVPE